MPLDLTHLILVTIGFFLVATIYSSIGHAGASGYTAILALVSFSPDLIRPVSLLLNVVVGTFAFYQFYKANLIDYKKLFPVLLGSVPLSYFSARLEVDKRYFLIAIGALLLFSSYKFLGINQKAIQEPQKLRAIQWPLAILVGAIIGIMSGLTGTGGAIFFTPFVLNMKWAEPKETSGMSIVFVLMNSISGLLGSSAVAEKIQNVSILPWVFAVICGAFVGTYFGIKKLKSTGLKRVLGLVLLIAGFKMLGMGFSQGP